jgi:hypothetical protein
MASPHHFCRVNRNKWSLAIDTRAPRDYLGLRRALTEPLLASETLAPMLGADNKSILFELGYGVEDIERLKLNRILHQSDKVHQYD